MIYQKRNENRSKIEDLVIHKLSIASEMKRQNEGEFV